MNKGFIKIIEVILAITLIFVVIDNIYSTMPPRYKDTQNINRLNRYAGDIVSSACYNKVLREDFVKGYIPINLSLDADAWNKSNDTRHCDTDSNSNGTLRQTTYFNRSATRIKICFETNGTMDADMKFSICQKDLSSDYNCMPNTLSQAYSTPTPTSAGLWCTNWFNYAVNKNKVYLVLGYTSDGDYTVYYLSGQNGFWWKDNVDETNLETTSGYTDHTSYPVAIHVYGYYDLGLNETLAPDLDYHIWLYSNNSNDGKLDELINESGNTTNSTMATSSCLISSYEKTYSPKKLVVGIWNKK